MVALVCGSPLMLDHSFPRSYQEMQLVAITLGEITKQIDNEEIELVITKELEQIIVEMDWNNRTDDYPLLIDIHRHLSKLFLRKHNQLVCLDLAAICDHSLHPTPMGCSIAGLVEIWADEVGKLLKVHDECCRGNNFFIGIACEKAYSGFSIGSFQRNGDRRHFPLIGPDDIEDKLIDAYVWDIHPDIRRKSLWNSNIFENYKVIGAYRIERPSGDSHYKVRFKNKRPWALDINVDPVPNRFISELETITGLPAIVLKVALLTGSLPLKRIRIPGDMTAYNDRLATGNYP